MEFLCNLKLIVLIKESFINYVPKKKDIFKMHLKIKKRINFNLTTINLFKT